MAAQELSRRFDHDVRAVVEGADVVGGSDRVVDDERDAVGVGDVGEDLQVEEVALGVGDRLAVEGAGAVVDERPPALRIVGILHEAHRDAELGQRALEQVVRAAVQGGGGDDFVALLGDVEDGVEFGGLAGGDEQGSGPSFERGQALLDDCLGRIGQARVDRSELGQGEAVGRGLGAGEDVGGRLVDGEGAGSEVGIGGLARVDLEGLEAPLVVGHFSSTPGMLFVRSGPRGAGEGSRARCAMLRGVLLSVLLSIQARTDCWGGLAARVVRTGPVSRTLDGHSHEHGTQHKGSGEPWQNPPALSH